MQGSIKCVAACAAMMMVAASGAVHAGEAEVRASVKAMMPQATIDSVTPSSASGYFEVVTQGQVLYVSADGSHLMAGDLWKVGDRANLTAKRKDGIRHDALTEVGAEHRIVFEADAPKHHVTVFTDFDCGYCQRLHHDIAQYNARGITVEYLLYPRGGLGSASFDKAVAVWCAADRETSFTLAKAGAVPPPKSCPNPIADNYALVTRIGGIIGTPTVVDASGAMTGSQSPEQMLARLDALK
jgi:thiol:disulfide interchange protein DsbC